MKNLFKLLLIVVTVIAISTDSNSKEVNNNVNAIMTSDNIIYCDGVGSILCNGYYVKRVITMSPTGKILSIREEE